MAHANDTLNGRLYAYELEEEKHLRRKFGYWLHVEERMIREQLRAEGRPEADLPGHDLAFRKLFDERRRENHKGDESYRETSQRLQRQWADDERRRFAAGESERRASLSRAELELIVEHFQGANDPVALSLLRKAGALLRDSTEETKA